MNPSVEHALGGGIAADFFVGEDCHQAFLQGSKAAFDLAFGLRAGSDEMGHAQGEEGALELGARIPDLTEASFQLQLGRTQLYRLRTRFLRERVCGLSIRRHENFIVSV